MSVRPETSRDRVLRMFVAAALTGVSAGLSGCGNLAPDPPAPLIAPRPTEHLRAKSPQALAGFDFLGIKSAHWDCNAMLSALGSLPEPIPCGAFLDETFGTSNACLTRLLSSGRCSSFRGHLAWTNHAPSTFAALAPRASYLDALAAEHSQVKFYASAICEHQMSAQRSAALDASLKPRMPHVSTIVDSGTKGVDPAATRECHGPSLVCPAVSLDGQSFNDEDVEAFKSHGTEYALLWGLPFNCKYSDQDKRPAPRRTDCPTPDYFNLAVRSAYPMPIWPPGVPHITSPEIWKPVSENHGGCKGKDCHPVAILNRDYGPQIRILAMNGRPLNSMYRVLPPLGRQSRYYSYLTAFQIGQLAEQTAASEFVFLDAPGYRVVVNPYRRGGKFH